VLYPSELRGRHNHGGLTTSLNSQVSFPGPSNVTFLPQFNNSRLEETRLIERTTVNERRNSEPMTQQ
jgi:hypothetical protein